MQDEKTYTTTKILPITINMLDSILETSKQLRKIYKNVNFEYFCFVARLISTDQALVFTDETGFLRYELRYNQGSLKPKSNYYYECLCSLKTMDKSFQIDLINLRPVDGNFITLHAMRVIRK